MTMKPWVWPLLLCVGLWTLGCEPLDDGAGGGVGNFPFERGFVFVRADRNLYAVNDADPSEVGQLTDTGGNAHPSLSRDGRRVVFVHSASGVTELQFVASSGGTPTPVLTSDATRTRFRHPVWSPDGQRIVFTYDAGGSSYLGVVNTDGTGFRELVGGTLSYGSASFYPDGVSVLAAAGNSPSQLTLLERVNIESRQATSVSNTLGNEASAIANRVVVSPDGTDAAFDAALGSGATRVFVMDLQSSARTVRRLTDYPGEPNASDGYPTWRGGAELAFQSDTGGNDNVYVLPAASQGQSGGLTVPSALEPWYGPN